VSQCMNTRHAEGQVEVEVSYVMAREHTTWHVDAHVLPCMRPEACRTTHRRSGGSFLLVGTFYIYLATLVHFYSFRHTKNTLKRGLERERERERKREREKEVRCFRNIDIFRKLRNCWEVPKDCPEEKEGYFRVLISPDHFIKDIEVRFWDLTSRYQDEDLGGIKGAWSTSGINESSHIA